MARSSMSCFFSVWSPFNDVTVTKMTWLGLRTDRGRLLGWGCHGDGDKHVVKVTEEHHHAFKKKCYADRRLEAKRWPLFPYWGPVFWLIHWSIYHSARWVIKGVGRWIFGAFEKNQGDGFQCLGCAKLSEATSGCSFTVRSRATIITWRANSDYWPYSILDNTLIIFLWVACRIFNSHHHAWCQPCMLDIAAGLISIGITICEQTYLLVLFCFFA